MFVGFGVGDVWLLLLHVHSQTGFVLKGDLKPAEKYTFILKTITILILKTFFFTPGKS